MDDFSTDGRVDNTRQTVSTQCNMGCSLFSKTAPNMPHLRQENSTKYPPVMSDK